MSATHDQPHSHGLIDDSIKRSRDGVRAVRWPCSCSA
jgi:hypothetical protein